MIIVQQSAFKVGDRVRVKSNILECYGLCGTVTTIYENYPYPIRVKLGDDSSKLFTVSELELLPSPKSTVILKPEYQQITATFKNGYVKLGHNLVIPAECVQMVEPQHYSGTVICGYCEDGLFTEHKAYIVKDGELISDNGTIRRFISIEDINKAYLASSFFELIPAEVSND